MKHTPSHQREELELGQQRAKSLIPVAVWSKAEVGSLVIYEIAGSNPAEGKGVCLLWLLSVA